MAKRVAVIDIGSNSVRMVVYEKSSRYAFHLLHEAKSKVRISQNAYKFDGNLQAEPMQRAFSALENFLQISKSFKTKKLLCVATSALRDAPNKKEFLNRVKTKLGINIKIISGQKEAYFGAIACANLLAEQNNALTIDIGGGSTEFAFISKEGVSKTLSLKLGTVRLKELFFDSMDIEAAQEYIDTQLDLLEVSKVEGLIGIGGTFRAVATTIMQQESYPLNKLHGYEITPELFSRYTTKIIHAESQKELLSLGIKENRLDVIQPGTLILERLLKRLEITMITTSGVGVREGVYLADLLRHNKHRFPHNYNTSVKYLLDAHVQESHFSTQLAQLSKKLFDLTATHFALPQEYRYELGLAAKLYPIGANLHFFSQNKHTYYLIQNALEYGFSHKSITLIATLTKYAKSKLPATSHLQKYKLLLPDTHTTEALSFLLSLTIALLSHRPRSIDFALSFENGILQVVSSINLYLTKEAVAKLTAPKKGIEVKISAP